MKKALPLLLLMVLIALTAVNCQREERKTPVSPEEELTAGSDQKTSKPRILLINSYDPDFPWTRGIMEGLLSSYSLPWQPSGELTADESPVILNIFNMDTQKNQSPEHIKSAAQEAKELIEEWQPDVVIASDDNASKYLIVPYFKDSSLPFVFCGINWSAEEYGFPTANITGMIEVSQISTIVRELLPYAGGDRITFLRGDAHTSRKEAAYLQTSLSYDVNAVLVSTYEEWKREFLRLQKDTDILITTYPSAMTDWDGDEEALHRFMVDNTEIPTGSWDYWIAENVLITIANSSEEQGEWAARTALEIAGGKTPSQFPIQENIRGIYYLNMGLAKKLNIKFPLAILEESHMVNTFTD